mgnify:CR=1 FL=1
MLFFKPSLERLGIAVSVRTIDPTQYRKPASQLGFRRRSFRHWPESLSPGNEQREFWGSQAADMAGSRNIIGIKNPAIDKLIEARHLHQGSRRSGGGNQGARSRAIVESLRRAAVELSETPYRALRIRFGQAA